MYEFLLSVHLLAAVAWVGGGITLHIMGRFARAAGGTRIVEYAREANMIGPRFYAPLSLILLVAGLLLVDEAGYDFSQAWISLALLGWIISFVIGVAFYGPQGKKLEEAAAAEGPEGPGVLAIFERIRVVNMVEITILLLVVVDMAVKPGV